MIKLGIKKFHKQYTKQKKPLRNRLMEIKFTKFLFDFRSNKNYLYIPLFPKVVRKL